MENTHSSAWLIVVAWVAAIVSVGYFGLFALGMAMSPGSGTRLSSYETVAVGIWPAIVAMAVLASAKRGNLSRSQILGFLLPVIMAIPGAIMSLSGLNQASLAVALIWISPLIALIFDIWRQKHNNVGFALETLLIGSLVLAPFRVLTHGLDFGRTRAHMDREAEEHRNRMMRQRYFAELYPFLKTTFRQNLGPWHLIASRGPGEEGLDQWRTENLDFINPDEAGFRYENAAPIDSIRMKKRVALQIKETKIQLSLVEVELTKFENDWKMFQNEPFTQKHKEEEKVRRKTYWDIVGRKNCLTRQVQWNEAQWQRWNERENQIKVRLAFFLSGDNVPNMMTIGDLTMLESSGSDVILPWSQWPRKGEESSSSDLEYTCILGESNKTAQAHKHVIMRTYFDPPFSFKSLGMQIVITARSAQLARSFIEQLDLQELKVFTHNPPVALIRGEKQ